MSPFLAQQLFVFYAVCVGAALAFPVAAFAVTRPRTLHIMRMLELVRSALFAAGFFPVLNGADGASEHRSYQQHFLNYAVPRTLPNSSPFGVAQQLVELGLQEKCFWLSDGPHCLKKWRNSLFNHLRSMWFKGLPITKAQILATVERKNPLGQLKGLRKITNSHLDLTNFSKMNVRLAAQICSNSMRLAVLEVGPENNSLAKYLGVMNELVDAFNSRVPITSGCPPVVTPLREMVSFLAEWEADVEVNGGSVEKNMPTREVVYDVRLLCLGLAGFLLHYMPMFRSREPNFYILAYKLNQDIVEMCFSHLRGNCGGNR